MALTFTDDNFEAEVLQASKLNVIDFWAPWCGPCVAMTPTIESLATEYEGKVNIGKVNVDENSNLSFWLLKSWNVSLKVGKLTISLIAPNLFSKVSYTSPSSK